MGRLGGSRNTDAQKAARAANAKLAGRPRRICTTCGQPVHGGHKRTEQNIKCDGRTWAWQTPREKREAKAVAKTATKRKQEQD